MKDNRFFYGAKCALPICLGLIPVGISYGLLAIQSGLSSFQTVLMSVLVMAGSSQLMAVGMLSSATIPSIIIAVFCINLRHIVMSSSVMSKLKHVPMYKKLLCAFALCDESFALFSFSGTSNAMQLLGTNTALYMTWVLSSLVGCIAGQLLPESISKGFSIAFYASFIALLTPHATKSRSIFYLIMLAAGMNTGLQFFISPSWSLIISMVASAFVGTLFMEEHKND